MSDCPLARSADLLVEPLDDELLVFDERSKRAHSLNATAALVWRAADGTRTREQIAAECGLDVMVVDLALETLSSSQLLIDFAAPSERVSRRAVLRRTAVAGAGLGVALPVIRSLVAPTAAMAAASSMRRPKNFAPCNSDGSCSAGSFCRPNGSEGICVREPGASCYYDSANPTSGSGCSSYFCGPTGSCPNPPNLGPETRAYRRRQAGRTPR